MSSNSSSMIGTWPCVRESSCTEPTTARSVIETTWSEPAPVARSSSITRARRSIGSPAVKERTTCLCGSSRPT